MVTVGAVPIRTRLFQEAPYLPARNKIRPKALQTDAVISGFISNALDGNLNL